MIHKDTVFAQLLKLLPRHEFETLAKQHHSGRAFRKNSRWSQLVTMMMGQVSGRNSLRDMIDNLSAQARRLYHLGCSLFRVPVCPGSTMINPIRFTKSYLVSY